MSVSLQEHVLLPLGEIALNQMLSDDKESMRMLKCSRHYRHKERAGASVEETDILANIEVLETVVKELLECISLMMHKKAPGKIYFIIPHVH